MIKKFWKQEKFKDSEQFNLRRMMGGTPVDAQICPWC